MVTTFPAVRDMQAALIEARTPTSIAQVPFRREEGRVEFREWAQKNPTACLRRFQIMRTDIGDPPEVTNTDVEIVHTATAVTVAYPKTMGTYGADNIRDLSDVVHEDSLLIADTIGPRGQDRYSLDAWPEGVIEDVAVEDGGSVWFATTTIPVAFHEERP